jgi:hypothetical protein
VQHLADNRQSADAGVKNANGSIVSHSVISGQ